MFTTYLQQRKLVITTKEKGAFWGLLCMILKEMIKNNWGNRLTLKFFHSKFFVNFLKIIIRQFSSHSRTQSNKCQSNSIESYQQNKRLLIYLVSHLVSKRLLNDMYIFYPLTKRIRNWLRLRELTKKTTSQQAFKNKYFSKNIDVKKTNNIKQLL